MSPYLTDSQTELYLSACPNGERIRTAHALARFAESARYPDDYRADARWADAVQLSSEGALLLEEVRRLQPAIPLADANMALFGHFYWRALLIDIADTDIDTVRSIIGAELASGACRLPFRFGRLLYDLFNSRYPHGTVPELSAEESWSLLQGTPAGVFQIGTLLTGPLGLQESHQQRYYPPSVPHALWHTRYRGEIVGYGVPFNPPDVPIVTAYKAVSARAPDVLGAPSEWSAALARLSCSSVAPHAPHSDIAMHVADCLIGGDRTALVEAGLASAQGEHLRRALANSPGGASAAKGSPSDIASRLTPEQQLQLVMILPNDELVKLIDSCCQRKQIKVPTFESRKTHMLPPNPTGETRTATELSADGVRFASENGTLRLVGMIVDGHRQANSVEDLLWKLRSSTPETAMRDVADLVRREGPTVAVRKLLLSNRGAAHHALRELSLPAVGLSEDDLERLILWKCGYDMPKYSRTLPDLRSRLSQFQEAAVSTVDFVEESQRAAIRSVGVNLFVSVEEFLEALVAYLVWLLASDHLATDLTFRYSDALRTVSDVLGPRVGSERDSTTTPAWDISGHNTLGVLQRYLAELPRWMAELPDRSRSEVQRPQSEVPHDATLLRRRFAFGHTQLWADCSPSALNRLATNVSEIVRILGRADVSGVRNAVDHKRSDDDFPSVDRLVSFAVHMAQVVERVEQHRLFPKEYWLIEKTTDRYEQTTYRLQDYRGAVLELHAPSPLLGLRWPERLTFGGPAVVAPEGLFGAPNSEICFGIGSDSSYARYWRGFPIVREADVGSALDDSAVVTQTSEVA